MTKSRLFFLKNRMLVANLIASFIGVSINLFLIRRADIPIPREISAAGNQMNAVFLPLSFLFGFLFTFIYELPIRKYLNRRYRNISVSAAFSATVRRRLLNEPFALIAMDFCIWVAAAFSYTAGFKRVNAPGAFLQLSFLGSLTTGLITITAAFFVFEFIMQRLHAPYFFPAGGLYATPKTLKIKIRTRLIAFLFACNLIPFFSIFHVLKRMNSAHLDPTLVLERLSSAIVTQSIVFIGVAIWLTFLVSSNLTRPFKEIIEVLRAIQKGSFDRKVRVTSNDEIGYTGDVINEMTEGLKERDRMRRSLGLAKEIQQNLLPKRDPEIDGLEIAGKSIYCDETGGDYFDYLDRDGNGKAGLSVVVGDVAGHGIPSALLMATARASLRQRSAMAGSIGEIVSDVNRQLTRDVEESGQFMTLFYLTIDPGNRRLQWVRAGHDPAVFYDPAADTFEELYGSGVAMGLDEHWKYDENERTGLEDGQIILLGTDGIWEALNANGEMFGKPRIFDIVRQNAAAGAKDISDRIFAALKDFQAGSRAEDDVTLVVVKIDRSAARNGSTE